MENSENLAALCYILWVMSTSCLLCSNYADSVGFSCLFVYFLLFLHPKIEQLNTNKYITICVE